MGPNVYHVHETFLRVSLFLFNPLIQIFNATFRGITISPLYCKMVVRSNPSNPISQTHPIFQSCRIIKSHVIHNRSSHPMFVQEFVIAKLFHRIKTTTDKIMLQSQRVSNFMRDHHFYQFSQQFIRHFDLSGKTIDHTALSKIPLLYQIPNTTEYSHMTCNYLARAGIHGRRTVSILDKRSFPRNKRVASIIF